MSTPAGETRSESVNPSVDGPQHPLREMLTIALPTIVTMTSYTVMQFVDGWMVSRIGPEPVYVSAQGNGGMAAWMAIAAVLGLTGIINTYVSQNLGAGKPERGAAYVWNGWWMCVAVWVLAMLPYAIVLPHIFASFEDHSEELVRMERGYANILVLGSILTMGAKVVAHYFYGMHRPGVVMVAALTGNVVNVFANWVLIFGNLGGPTLGVVGAAWGTLIGTAVELSIPLAMFLGPMHARYATRQAWRPSMLHIKDILKLGWPAGAMMFSEMVCWGWLMAVLLPKAGAVAGDNPVHHNTAGWVALRYMHVSFMPTVGLSVALTAIVGRCMGMRRPDLAAERTWLALKLALAYMGVWAVAFVLFREPMIRLFIPETMSELDASEVIRIGGMVLIAAAVFQIFDAVAIVTSGALRGAGDAVWPGVVMATLSWGCLLGGGTWIIKVAPGLGSVGPWAMAATYIVLAGVLLLARFSSGKWRTMRVVHDEPIGEAQSLEGEPATVPIAAAEELGFSGPPPAAPPPALETTADPEPPR